jgi:hypothetical protein
MLCDVLRLATLRCDYVKFVVNNIKTEQRHHMIEKSATRLSVVCFSNDQYQPNQSPITNRQSPISLVACGLWLVACGLWLVACGFCSKFCLVCGQGFETHWHAQPLDASKTVARLIVRVIPAGVSRYVSGTVQGTISRRRDRAPGVLPTA